MAIKLWQKGMAKLAIKAKQKEVAKMASNRWQKAMAKVAGKGRQKGGAKMSIQVCQKVAAKMPEKWWQKDVAHVSIKVWQKAAAKMASKRLQTNQNPKSGNHGQTLQCHVRRTARTPAHTHTQCKQTVPTNITESGPHLK